MTTAVPGAEADPQDILVVCLDNAGDLVFVSALLPALRRRYPAARIGLWCKAYAREIAALFPGVDEIFAADPFWDRAPGRGKGSLPAFVRVARSVRRAGYRTALVASPQWRACAATWAAGVPVRIGTARRRNARWLTLRLPAYDPNRPMVQELGRLLAPVGAEAADLRCELSAAPLAQPAARILERMGPAPFALVHPFVSDPRRRVALPPWIELGNALPERGLRVLWNGTPAELAELRSAAPARPDWSYIDEVSPGRFTDAAAASILARLYVGHDSGPLHVANALGAPCVGVYPPSCYPRTRLQGSGPGREVVAAAPALITAANILRAVDEMLAPATVAARAR